MEFTLEQARALDAVARLGGFARAAAELKKGHTGVIYLIKTLEDRLNLKLLDRTGYRTRLTPTGNLVLAECRKLLGPNVVPFSEMHAGLPGNKTAGCGTGCCC